MPLLDGLLVLTLPSFVLFSAILSLRRSMHLFHILTLQFNLVFTDCLPGTFHTLAQVNQFNRTSIQIDHTLLTVLFNILQTRARARARAKAKATARARARASSV